MPILFEERWAEGLGQRPPPGRQGPSSLQTFEQPHPVRFCCREQQGAACEGLGAVPVEASRSSVRRAPRALGQETVQPLPREVRFQSPLGEESAELPRPSLRPKLEEL